VGWGVSTSKHAQGVHYTVHTQPTPPNYTHNIRMRVWVLAGSLITESQEH